MAIKKAKYKVAGDTYHFETNDQMVRVMDRNDNVRGTLRELVFQGKEVKGGSFKDIKQTGTYQVTGLTDLPEGFPKDQKCILEVTAIGDPDNPDVILYRAISPNGTISENTVSNGKESTWGSGGIKLQNDLKKIDATLDSMRKTRDSDIETYKKDKNDFQQKYDKLTNDLQTHNHDERYVLKSGDTMSGSLDFKNGTGIGYQDENGGRHQGITFQDGKMILGDKDKSIDVQSKELTFNGGKVITEKNVDLIKKEITKIITDNHVVHSYGDEMDGDLTFVEDASVRFKRHGDQVAKISADDYGNISLNGFNIDAGGQVTQISFVNGLYLESTAHSNYISTPAFSANDLTSRQLSVNGKKVFLQQDQPSGYIPAGSVWIRY